MTYSIDFRKKVLSIRVQQNLSIDEVAKRFGIAKSTVVRWLSRLEPQRTRNKPATKIDMVRLAQEVALHPDAYQHELAELLGVSQKGICNALKRLGINRKNKRSRTSRSISKRSKPSKFK